MTKKLISYALVIFAALGAVDAQSQQTLSGTIEIPITITGETQINTGDTAINNSSFTVSSTGILSNYGNFIAINCVECYSWQWQWNGIYDQPKNYGQIINYSKMHFGDVASFYNSGSIVNYGELSGEWNQPGTINAGSFTNYGNAGLGLRSSYGSINNFGSLSIFLSHDVPEIFGSLVNNGSISNFAGSGGINLRSSGLLTNSGSFETISLSNEGLINNTGTIHAWISYHQTSGLLNNAYGSTFNMGNFFQISGGTVLNSGVINLEQGGPEKHISGDFINNTSGIINNYNQLKVDGSQLHNDGQLNNYNQLTLLSGIYDGTGSIKNDGKLVLDGTSTLYLDSLDESLLSSLSFNTGDSTIYSDTAHLDGTFEIDLTNFSQTLGQKIRPIYAHHFSGSFTSFQLKNSQFEWTAGIVPVGEGLYAFEVNLVPVPASVWMLLSGLGGLGLFAQKRKRVQV